MSKRNPPMEHGRFIYLPGGTFKGARLSIEAIHAVWLDEAERQLNAHDELVAALRSIEDTLSKPGREGADVIQMAGRALIAARAALVKAQP